MTIVDLTHVLRPGIANPRDQPHLDLQLETVRDIAEEGVQVLRIGIGNHAGTHVDAPSHIIAGGATVADLDVGRFYGPAAVVDIPLGPDAAIDAAELEEVEPEIRPGDIVFFCTGWGERIGTSEYSDHHPYLTPAGAQWLVDREVKLVGIDVSSLECPFSKRPPGFRHDTLRILLDAGIPAFHNLANLERIAGSRCRVAAFPVPIAGSDAGLARVVAFTDEEER